MIFRALWPITDESKGWAELCAEARAELPLTMVRAHARPTGAGRFSIAAAAHTPGSGNTTRYVLLFECPAEQAEVRAYWKPQGRGQHEQAVA